MQSFKEHLANPSVLEIIDMLYYKLPRMPRYWRHHKEHMRKMKACLYSLEQQEKKHGGHQNARLIAKKINEYSSILEHEIGIMERKAKIHRVYTFSQKQDIEELLVELRVLVEKEKNIWHKLTSIIQDRKTSKNAQ